MVQQEKRKSRLSWLLWAGFVILLLVVGLGPLLLLASYTREGGLRDFFRINSDTEVELPPSEQLQLEPYMVQYIYRYCEHSQAFQPGNIPPDLAPPPQVLAEIAAALHNSNLHIDNLMEYLKGIDGWYLVEMKAGAGQPFFTLTYLDDFCPDCVEHRYLGVFDDRIAVYQGLPPHGKLLEVTGYEVKELHRAELETGVSFNSEEQKDILLEGFTS